MSLYFGIKLLSDLSLYYAFSSFLCYLAGGRLVPLLPEFLIVFCGLAVCLLQEKRWRMLPLVLGLAPFAFAQSLVDVLLLLFPLLYTAFLCHQKLFGVDRSRLRDTFVIALMLLPLLLAVGLFAFDLSVLERYSIPFIILYLGSTVLLLRMLRHDPETLLERKFRLINIGTIFVFCLLGLAMSTGVFLNALGDALYFLYSVLIYPFIRLLIWVYGGILWLLNLLFSGGLDKEPQKEQIVGNEPGYATDPPPDPLNLDFLASLFIALGIIAGCVVLYFVIRILLRKRRPPASVIQTGIMETREFIQAAEQPERSVRFAPRDPRLAVRFYYRKFLLLCKKRGLRITENQTSQQVHRLACESFDADLSARLRASYLPARYDDASQITKADVDAMRSLYNHLKKDS